MGISTKKDRQTTKPVYEKEIKGAYGNLTNTYNQQAPKIAGIADNLTGMLPEMQRRYLEGNPALNAAQGYVTDTLAGDGTNPHLDQWIADQQGQSQNMLGAKLNKLGVGPAGATYQGLAARENARVGLGMRYADWDAGQQRKAQAAGLAPGISAAESASVAPMLGVAELGAGLPMDAAMKYAGGTAGLLGDYTDTLKKDSPSKAQQIGKGLKVASQIFSMFSDARLKTDVRRVGQTDEGLSLYSFRYGGDGPFHIGPMAQEVREVQPDALGPVVGGYMTVHYERVR